MLLKIDTRETELFKHIQSTISAYPTKFKSIQPVLTPLPIGDIILMHNDAESVIIERKSVADLAASITDGRYEEQSYRLNGIPHPNHNIVYLVEGNLFTYHNPRIDKHTLYSAMFSILYFKGFSLLHTSCIEETALLLCNMICKLYNGIKKGKKAFYTNNTFLKGQEEEQEEEKGDKKDKDINDEQINCPDKGYSSVVKRIKKDNITPENIGEIMLSQIPGVSTTIALAIMNKFHTLPKLIESIQTDALCMNDICTVDPKGKPRKISKTAIASILTFLSKKE